MTTHKYCSECYTLDPTIIIENGSEVYDEPFGNTTFTQHWTRESTECCDVEEIELTDSELQDIIVQETPEVVSLLYDTNAYKAQATFAIDIKLYHQLYALKDTDFGVIHPKALEPHNKMVSGTWVLEEEVFYDWIEDILKERVNYETSHYTVYRVNLHLSEPHAEMRITWIL